MQSHTSKNFFVALQMTAASCTFVALGVSVKLLGETNLSLATVTFSRFFISFLAYLPAYIIYRPGLWQTHFWGMFWRCLLGLLATALSFAAARSIQLGNATLLTLTSPLFTFLLAPKILGAHITKSRWGWFLIAVAGVFCLVHVETKIGSSFRLIAGLLSGLTAAVSYMVIRKLHETESFLSISFTYALVASILSFVWMILENSGAFGQTTTTFIHLASLREIGLLILCGVLATIYQGLYTHALRRASASYVAPLLYSSVVLSFLVGWIFFEEPVTVVNGIGAGLVIIAMVFLGRK